MFLIICKETNTIFLFVFFFFIYFISYYCFFFRGGGGGGGSFVLTSYYPPEITIGNYAMRRAPSPMKNLEIIVF